jgi:hypothetical protein
MSDLAREFVVQEAQDGGVSIRTFAKQTNSVRSKLSAQMQSRRARFAISCRVLSTTGNGCVPIFALLQGEEAHGKEKANSTLKAGRNQEE